ncbi:MAG: pentapeptide repeat-containing protein, partial [Actinomycetota bacterium]
MRLLRPRESGGSGAVRPLRKSARRPAARTSHGADPAAAPAARTSHPADPTADASRDRGAHATLVNCESRIGPGADLAGCDLSDLDLSNLDLSRTNLEDASLAGSDLSGSNLSDA